MRPKFLLALPAALALAGCFGGGGTPPQLYTLTSAEVRPAATPRTAGQGPVTASQTGWALLGLIAADEARSDAVRRGIEWLLENQQTDGNWHEDEFTGTGFPKVFYLKYHNYRLYFPLMALGRYRAIAGHVPRSASPTVNYAWTPRAAAV